MIKDRLLCIRGNIERVCQKANRNPADITLVGVTKFASLDDIRQAVAAGITDIGENKVQAAQEKFPQLAGLPQKVTRHMIGHLQTNKVKVALELFDLIQSVDSLRLAQEIDKQAGKQGRVVDILIQVDCGGEEQKFGVPQDEAIGLVEKVLALSNIRVCGLMTIAPFTSEQEVVRTCFRDLRQLAENIANQFPVSDQLTMQYLSMGMTHDYEIALEEGANMLRIGTAIFA